MYKNNELTRHKSQNKIHILNLIKPFIFQPQVNKNTLI